MHDLFSFLVRLYFSNSLDENLYLKSSLISKILLRINYLDEFWYWFAIIINPFIFLQINLCSNHKFIFLSFFKGTFMILPKLYIHSMINLIDCFSYSHGITKVANILVFHLQLTFILLKPKVYYTRCYPNLIIIF